MLVSKFEVNAVAVAVADAEIEKCAQELSLLELAIVGGGIGETIL
ncbi:MAG TPA: hypothetical protein VH040_17795 [Usitatibacter sp.]|jgi:hypothetical protein|nr:hypothetical protein [Usitatibacter sp.]